MAENVMFGMAVITEWKFSIGRKRYGIEVHILEVLFRLFRVTFGTVHIHKPFPEVNIGIGMDMTVYACELSFFMHILCPFLGIYIKRTNDAIL
jgi:hypothetical protein